MKHTRKYIEFDMGLDGSAGEFFVGYTGDITGLLGKYPGKVIFATGRREVDGKDFHQVLHLGADIFDAKHGEAHSTAVVVPENPTMVLFETCEKDHAHYMAGLMRLAARKRREIAEKKGEQGSEMYSGAGKLLVVTPEYKGDGFMHILRSRVDSQYHEDAEMVDVLPRNRIPFGEHEETVYTVSNIGKDPDMDPEMIRILKVVTRRPVRVVPFEESVPAIGEALERVKKKTA